MLALARDIRELCKKGRCNGLSLVCERPGVYWIVAERAEDDGLHEQECLINPHSGQTFTAKMALPFWLKLGSLTFNLKTRPPTPGSMFAARRTWRLSLQPRCRLNCPGIAKLSTPLQALIVPYIIHHALVEENYVSVEDLADRRNTPDGEREGRWEALGDHPSVCRAMRGERFMNLRSQVWTWKKPFSKWKTIVSSGWEVYERIMHQMITTGKDKGKSSTGKWVSVFFFDDVGMFAMEIIFEKCTGFGPRKAAEASRKGSLRGRLRKEDLILYFWRAFRSISLENMRIPISHYRSHHLLGAPSSPDSMGQD